jgi:multimeric flavodoxin WrbA
MKNLLIVHHSRTGGTAQMVQAALQGASTEPAVAVRLCGAPSAGPEDVLAADLLVFAAPENLAALSGPMKDFFDRTYYPLLGKIEGRPYACMICAGSDGENAARQIARIATGWRLKPVAAPVIICTRAQTPEAILAPKLIAPQDLTICETLGATLAAGLAAGIF